MLIFIHYRGKVLKLTVQSVGCVKVGCQEWMPNNGNMRPWLGTRVIVPPRTPVGGTDGSRSVILVVQPRHGHVPRDSDLLIWKSTWWNMAGKTTELCY